MSDRRQIYQLLAESEKVENKSLHSTEEVVRWVQTRNESVEILVERTEFAGLDGWKFDRSSGFLRHDSGQFFSVRGLNVKTNWGHKPEWDQPIIDQPEIGFLGILTTTIDGVLHFLLQAKIEPGNVNGVQLSPTLQATKSNYTRIHQGASPKYLGYFQNRTAGSLVVFDQLQSEQGARFIGKRNRNLMVHIDEPILVDEDFIWVTLWQIQDLLRIQNLVNMDARTVVSGIPRQEFSYDDQAPKKRPMHRMTDLISWITEQKCKFEIEVSQKPLSNLRGWVVGTDSIRHENHAYFEVIAARIRIQNREVSQWCQPLIAPVDPGLVAFVCKRINDEMHFLVQSKLECGNFDIVELAPTVQCLTSAYEAGSGLPYLDYVLNAPIESIRYDVLLSEEGGRFWHEQNRHLIVEADGTFALDDYVDFRWVSLAQLYDFMRFNNYLNIQARSLLSAVPREF